MKKHVLPTVEQVEWADCEVGVIIHFDMFAFVDDKGYAFWDYYGNPPKAELFDPDALDTDQWVKTALDMGAKYAVLVAKHCTGFSLWPTKAHEYSIAHSPYKDGKGDIVGDFFASCKKYGIRPGLYCSLHCNMYYDAELPGLVRSRDPEEQKAYYDMCMKQLEELWTRYGKVFEIWFDGGVQPESEGGPAVAGLLHRLQPDAVVFGGPKGTKSLLRWCGNEDAVADEECSSLVHFVPQRDNGLTEREDNSDFDGDTWSPAECDTPSRDHEKAFMQGWFWAKDDEQYVYPAERLFDRYLRSVGRNGNLLVGMPIDCHGLCPKEDAEQFHRLGEMIRKVFGKPLAQGGAGAAEVAMDAADDRPVGYVTIGEDITHGERIRGYVLHCFDGNGAEVFTASGQIISHKRIVALPETVRKVTLEVTAANDTPIIRFMDLYGRL